MFVTQILVLVSFATNDYLSMPINICMRSLDAIFLGSKLSYQPELFFHAPTNIPHFVSKIIYYCFKNIENLSFYTVCFNSLKLNSINSSNGHVIQSEKLENHLRYII